MCVQHQNSELEQKLKSEENEKKKLIQQINEVEKKRAKEQEAFQAKVYGYERLNSELQQKLRSEENEKEKLKQKIHEVEEKMVEKVSLVVDDYGTLYSENEKLKKQMNEVEQKLAGEKDEFKKKSDGYATLNFELQMELRAEKSETEKLKQKNLELERRIAMLYNADNISEFVHEDHNTTVKQEFIKTEIKTELEN